MEKYTDKKLEKMRDAYNTPDNKSKTVPIENIKMEWHEGRTDKKNYEGKNFKSWKEYNKALEQINKDNKGDRKKGTYTKTKATFTWKDGTQRTERVDLGESEGTYNPDDLFDSVGKYKARRWNRQKIYSRTGRKLGTESEWSFIRSPKIRKKLENNPHKEGSELHEVYNRNVLSEGYYQGKIKTEDYNSLIKESVKRERQTREEDSLVKISKFKKEEPRAFNSAVDMQVEEDIKNNPKWDSFTDKDKDDMRNRLVERYEKNPELIKDKWYMATMRVYESKDFSKYMKKDAYTKGADKGNRGRAASFGNGKGKGWHGEMIRHRNAALKGRGMRR